MPVDQGAGMQADGPLQRRHVGAGPVISARDLTKIYHATSGSVKALESISFDIVSGEFVSVLGPSGCGKTTLMMLAAGLRKKTAGQLEVSHRPVDRPQTDVGIVFQRDVLLDWRTNLDNVLLQIELRKKRKSEYREQALDLLQSVGLKGFEHKHPFELSGGMRQRVSICRALIHDPPILFMDEPFGALDALTREQMMIDLESIWIRRAKTVMFITHSIPEAVFLSDRIMVMTPRPGTIRATFEIDLPRPRSLDDMTSPQFNVHIQAIRTVFQEMGVFQDVA